MACRFSRVCVLRHFMYGVFWLAPRHCQGACLLGGLEGGNGSLHLNCLVSQGPWEGKRDWKRLSAHAVASSSLSVWIQVVVIPIQHASYVIFTLLPRGERKQTELTANPMHRKPVILHTLWKNLTLLVTSYVHNVNVLNCLTEDVILNLILSVSVCLSCVCACVFVSLSLCMDTCL